MTDYTQYLKQIHDASLDVPQAPPLHRPGPDPTTTGLKVVDTMTPVRRGGTIELVGPVGSGQLVVAVELLYGWVEPRTTSSAWPWAPPAPRSDPSETLAI